MHMEGLLVWGSAQQILAITVIITIVINIISVQ